MYVLWLPISFGGRSLQGFILWSRVAWNEWRVKQHKSWGSVRHGIEHWADICNQREPGTESRAGAFIPNIETSLIKYCSHPVSPPGPWHVMLSQLARWLDDAEDDMRLSWPVSLQLASEFVSKRDEVRFPFYCIYNRSCDQAMTYISWEGRLSIVKTWQSVPSEMTWDNEDCELRNTRPL